MKVIECLGLNKSHGRVKALNDLSVSIEENKIVGLIGPNGAGKTTFLKIIAGFWRKTSGKISVFSENPFNSIKVSSNIVFIDDQMTFPPSLNMKDIIDSFNNFYLNFDKGLAIGLLKYFELDLRLYPRNLSKGMKNTFYAIMGIAARCPLTILDEPTTGMDAGVRKDFYRALLKDYVAYPRTIIISSHHLKEIEDLIEDVLLINNGTKLLYMPIMELMELAIRLRGKADIIREITIGKEIFHQENWGKDSIYAVMKNDFDGDGLRKAKERGIEISPISSEDICVYLTAKTKGGIDDVFNRG